MHRLATREYGKNFSIGVDNGLFDNRGLHARCRISRLQQGLAIATYSSSAAKAENDAY
jgi:hypothetical protein